MTHNDERCLETQLVAFSDKDLKTRYHVMRCVLREGHAEDHAYDLPPPFEGQALVPKEKT